MHQPDQLSLSQVKQQLEEVEAFCKTDLYKAFCEDFDTMAHGSIVHVVDETVTNIETFLNREQVIGELRLQRTARNWFADVHDELKLRYKQLCEEQQQQTTEEDKDNE